MTVDKQGSRMRSHGMLIVGRPRRISRLIRGISTLYPANGAWYSFCSDVTCLHDKKGIARFWDIPDSLNLNAPEAAAAELEKQ